MRSVRTRQLRRPSRKLRLRIHAPGGRRPHQNKYRPQEQAVKHNSGSRGKKGCKNECCEVQRGDHGVSPIHAMSCDNGNGTLRAMQNALRINDLYLRRNNASVLRETRRGHPDAHAAYPFGLASNQSYCSSVRKRTVRKHDSYKDANPPRHRLLTSRIASRTHSICLNAQECASAKSSGYPSFFIPLGSSFLPPSPIRSPCNSSSSIPAGPPPSSGA